MMNDRFKFRVWNGSEMHHNDFVVTATGYVGRIIEEFLGQCVFKQDDLTADNECILMQCTGLKDKNGKLIFEGDILQENWHKYILEWGKGTYVIKDIKSGTSYIFTAGMCIHKSEVIGNIYENADLLQECEE